jgi:hypothetical protein
VIAKRKGVPVRGRLKEAWKPRREPMDKNRIEAYGVGRVGTVQRSPDPSRAPVGKSGGYALKAVKLTLGDLSPVSIGDWLWSNPGRADGRSQQRAK